MSKLRLCESRVDGGSVRIQAQAQASGPSIIYTTQEEPGVLGRSRGGCWGGCWLQLLEEIGPRPDPATGPDGPRLSDSSRPRRLLTRPSSKPVACTTVRRHLRWPRGRPRGRPRKRSSCIASSARGRDGRSVVPDGARVVMANGTPVEAVGHFLPETTTWGEC